MAYLRSRVALAALVAAAVVPMTATVSEAKVTPTEVTHIARKQVGTRYVWGAASPRSGFDCSGLVDYAYRMAGWVFPQRLTTRVLRYIGRSVMGRRLKPGDMLLFDTGGHMGMYLGRGKVIHASSYFGRVVIQPLRVMRPRIIDVRRVRLSR